MALADILTGLYASIAVLAALQHCERSGLGQHIDLAAVFADPQVVARGLRVELSHPSAGRVPSVANPIRLSATPVEYRQAPPLLGEHTERILAGVLGLDSAQIVALHRDRVI